MPTATESAKKKGKAKPAVAKSAKKSGNSGSTQFVFFFGGGRAEGHGKMKAELGGKGAGLAEMTNAGLPVPPGFTIQTEACRQYLKNNTVPAELEKQTQDALLRLEKLTGEKLGDKDQPLLVSVRSGSKFSMPGMMDTILNLGLTDETVEGLARRTRNPDPFFVRQQLDRRSHPPQRPEQPVLLGRRHRHERYARRRPQPRGEIGILVVSPRSRREAHDRRLPPERHEILDRPAHLNRSRSGQRRHVPADREEALRHAALTLAWTRASSASSIRRTCAHQV